jgi:hypothetical protein
MKRVAVLIAVLLSVVAIGGASASAPARATDAAFVQHNVTPPVGPKTVVVNCAFKAQTRPSNFILTCADAGDVLAHLHWVSWSTNAAFATGIEQINNCTPDCAAGKFINYPVLVNLWRPEPLRSHPGTLYFSRVTRVYTANRPPLFFCNGKKTCYPQTATFTLWNLLPHP